MARQRSRWSAPGCVVRAAAWSPEWTVESRPPWRYRTSPASGSPAGAPGARLEVDEVPGREGRPPPADERGPRPEREVAPLAGLEQQVVEPVEGGLRRLAGRTNPSPTPSGPTRASWRTTATPPLSAPRIRWRVDLATPAKTAASSTPGAERQRHPVARRLDLLDRRRSRPPRSRRRNAVSEAGDLGVGGDHVHPLPGQRLGDRDERAAVSPGVRPLATGPRGT